MMKITEPLTEELTRKLKKYEKAIPLRPYNTNTANRVPAKNNHMYFTVIQTLVKEMIKNDDKIQI